MHGAQVKISLKPNNQITLTIGNWRKKILLPHQPPIAAHDRVDKKKLTNLTKIYAKDRESFAGFEENRLALAQTPPLDIIQRKQRFRKTGLARKNKPKSFTKVSGQRLREAGAAMDILCEGDLSQTYELCLTLPADHEDAFAALARNTYYASNRIFKHLRDVYGEECAWFYVWEYQRRGALHMHIAIRYPDRTKLPEICEGIFDIWKRILISIGERENTCMFTAKSGKACVVSQKWQHHYAQIRKAVGAYFSKYAGKTESKQSWYCQKYPISRFWGSSSAIKRCIRENSAEYVWDYQGRADLAIAKHEEILNDLIQSCSIISFNSYTFEIRCKHNHVARKDKEGKIHVYPIEPKVFAKGERYTAYVPSDDYQKFLEVVRSKIALF